jgi:hypothetical protein
MVGAFAERGRPGPILIFVFIRTTSVYYSIAHSIWNNIGWANHLGVLDFEGGTPVHISSGSAALATSIYFGKGPQEGNRYSNPTNVVLGTVLMIFGKQTPSIVDVHLIGCSSIERESQDGLVSTEVPRCCPMASLFRPASTAISLQLQGADRSRTGVILPRLSGCLLDSTSFMFP